MEPQTHSVTEQDVHLGNEAQCERDGEEAINAIRGRRDNSLG